MPNPRPRPLSRRPEPEPAASAPPRKGLWREVRELWDTLVLAFVLVTLMKTFVVDLYKIPSGSMSPTLIGDWMIEEDADDDGDLDLYLCEHRPRPGSLGLDYVARQVFIRGDDGVLRCATDEHRTLMAQTDAPRFSRAQVRLRYDRILVNKMWYWFSALRRGDIVVFKLPDTPDPRYPGTNRSLFDPLTPFYIKRVAALEGETPAIDAAGRLVIDGQVVNEPIAYQRNHYFATNPDTGFQPLPYLGVRVPPGQFYVFGDNSGNSWDSRYWGGVNVDRARGRAFFRYWPLAEISFLN